MVKLSMNSLDEVIQRLGECACRGLWPPENRLVFPYEEVKELSSEECVEDGCRTGIITVEKITSTPYKPFQRSEIQEQKSVVFFHKSAQEKCAGEYLSHLANTNPDELTRKLQMLDSAQKCLSVQMVLRFACGSGLNVARLILEKLVEILRLELSEDVRAYYANKLTDPDKVRLVQEFIETCLLCNYESGSTGQFNHLLAEIFPTGHRQLQFLGLSPYTSAAIAHFLSFCQGLTFITKIRVVQIPKPGTITGTGTMAVVDKIMAHVASLNTMLTYKEVENLYTEYVASHQDSIDLEDFTRATGQDIQDGLTTIGLWEYFKTWHSSDSQINIDPILDTVKFTRLDELDVTDVKLSDAGQKLTTAIAHGHLYHVTRLVLPYTGLSTDAMNDIIMCLPKCMPMIQVLDISNNDASSSEVILNLTKSLPMISLHELGMVGMSAPASNMAAFAHVIPRISTNLTALRMKGNNMDDGTGKTLVSTLPHARHLEVLSIDVGRMSRKIHRELIMMIKNLQQLKRLSVNSSLYVDELVLFMAQVIKSLSDLNSLTLSAYTHSHLKTSREAADSSILNRTAWRLFMFSVQPMATQMRRLELWGDINLHAADLQDLLSLCRKNRISLGYHRRLWEGVDIRGVPLTIFNKKDSLAFAP